MNEVQTTPYTYHGDMEGAFGLVKSAVRKLESKWWNQRECLSDDDIRQEESTIRLIRAAVSEYKDVLDNFKAVAALRADAEKTKK